MRLILLLVMSITFTFSGLASADTAKGKTYPTKLVPVLPKPEPPPKVVKKPDPVCFLKKTERQSFTPGATYVTEGIFIPICTCCGSSVDFLPGSHYQDPGQMGTVVTLETVCE